MSEFAILVSGAAILLMLVVLFAIYRGVPVVAEFKAGANGMKLKVGKEEAGESEVSNPPSAPK
jgi:hypothetical protein